MDFIKADDMLWPYHDGEIEALAQAIQHSGRDIVLSLPPGVELSLNNADHLKRNSQLWRISADFWDRWEDLKAQFDTCQAWETNIGPNSWPDADMLPLGHIGIRAERGEDRQSLLTHDEQITLMTLWSIFRSPLMFGGDLPSSDQFTLDLLTNAEVIHINQASCRNRELLRNGDCIVWVADSDDSDDIYLALFNIGDGGTMTVEVDLSLLDNNDRSSTIEYELRDLWYHTELGLFSGSQHLQQPVAPHGARLYRLRCKMRK